MVARVCSEDESGPTVGRAVLLESFFKVGVPHVEKCS